MRDNCIKNAKRKISVDKVIRAINEFFEESGSNNASSISASTRDIANRSELSIYNARHILIKLEQEGVITSFKKENSKSLYWNKTGAFKG
ncbi:FaeA/PapI family transcriptional regulator [Erwinia tasmaniensis]|uniref:FaeA-like protein n=1 Tax=Erwinia tasmaniensis (strain DSM 17950 / CFBP 7177 / CIP 109463 / NCPPB 4357 / Et1/99) TaxID=465817 RepID=B2VCE8_ERWT9|nr:FaeA/PapI family transcriptional regulator [Erwinia tasmaniensis]CAO98469.1 hypothetical protein ETA_34230 [Erwinia tasmaniensis Et1/99]